METIKKNIRIKKIRVDDKIVFDTNGSYNIKILLTSSSLNLGFFESNDDTEGVDGDLYIISGETYSRLDELKKTKHSSYFFDNYFISTDINTNGLNIDESVIDVEYVYYIDGIKFIDYINENKTYFFVETNGLNSINSIHTEIYKDINLLNLITKPKVSSDIFIDRQKINIVEKIFRTKYLKKMDDIYNYNGGSYYKIIKNE